MQRVYHPYDKWEEYHAGMWRIIMGQERKELLDLAIGFTGNAELYGSYMMMVIEDWPISCEHNLTCDGMNRQAWIGHAACCIAIGCPEDITRDAWHRLTKDQQDMANEKADEAISEWEFRYMQGQDKPYQLVLFSERRWWDYAKTTNRNRCPSGLQG